MARFPDEAILRRVITEGEAMDRKRGGRLAWLVEFARLDPARLDPARWESEYVSIYGYQLLACALGPLSPNLVSFGPESRLVPLTAREVSRLHGALRSWFHQLVTIPGGVPGVPVPTAGLTMMLVRATRPGEKPAIFGTSHGGPLRTMLFQRAAGWVAETDRLVACPTCGKPVLALRKRLYCSDGCLQTHHDRKKIAARRAAKKGVTR